MTFQQKPGLFYKYVRKKLAREYQHENAETRQHFYLKFFHAILSLLQPVAFLYDSGEHFKFDFTVVCVHENRKYVGTSPGKHFIPFQCELAFKKKKDCNFCKCSFAIFISSTMTFGTTMKNTKTTLKKSFMRGNYVEFRSNTNPRK